MGVNPSNLRLAKEEVLWDVLGVKKGQVSPFALINDTEQKVKKVIMDQNLVKEEYLGLHPLDNEETWEINTKGFIDGFMKGILDRELTIVDVQQEVEKVEQPEQKGKQQKQ